MSDYQTTRLASLSTRPAALQYGDLPPCCKAINFSPLYMHLYHASKIHTEQHRPSQGPPSRKPRDDVIATRLGKSGQVWAGLGRYTMPGLLRARALHQTNTPGMRQRSTWRQKGFALAPERRHADPVLPETRKAYIPKRVGLPTYRAHKVHTLFVRVTIEAYINFWAVPVTERAQRSMPLLAQHD